ncbi:MAG TPA: thioredoxin family protein [Candidatus Nanopelagicaceae bacterium]
MDIKILGPGCKNCVTLDRITREAVSEMGIQATIEKIEDYTEIASYGVMTTPALVVDGRVLIAGRVPTPTHLRELLMQH